tara:strand:- start:63938 stop:64051 length:114 start_codon:yes stop_codon:yes gene_type:complete
LRVSWLKLNKIKAEADQKQISKTRYPELVEGAGFLLF